MSEDNLQNYLLQSIVFTHFLKNAGKELQTIEDLGNTKYLTK